MFISPDDPMLLQYLGQDSMDIKLWMSVLCHSFVQLRFLGIHENLVFLMVIYKRKCKLSNRQKGNKKKNVR